MRLIDTIKDKYGNTLLESFVTTVKLRSGIISQHCHSEFEISLVLSGNGLYRTPSGILEIQKDDIFLFSTNERHKISDVFPDGDKDYMQLLTFKFSPSFILKIDSVKNDTEYMNVFFNRKKNFSNRIDRNNIHNQELNALMLSMQKECEEKKKCYSAVVQGTLIEILILLLRYYDLAENTPGKESRYVQNINEATAYINRNFTEKLTLDDILQVAHMNKTTFIASFKAVYNMTTWDYINIKRIEKALTLLKSTDLTVLDIALQCGFNSTVSFNKIFKKITDTTPKNYRTK